MIMMIRARWSSSSHYTKHTDLIEKEFTKRLQSSQNSNHRKTQSHRKRKSENAEVVGQMLRRRGLTHSNHQAPALGEE